MKKVKIFNLQQRMVGMSPVCTCCNITLTGAEKRISVDGHELHTDCAEKLGMIIWVKESLRPVIDNMLPNDFFNGSNILEMLQQANTVSGFKSALYAFCQRLTRGKDMLLDKFDQIVASITAVIEQSKMKVILMPILEF